MIPVFKVICAVQYNVLDSDIIISEIVLTGACTATPTGQCADTNAECDGTKNTCGCKSTHFVNNTGACQLS